MTTGSGLPRRMAEIIGPFLGFIAILFGFWALFHSPDDPKGAFLAATITAAGLTFFWIRRRKSDSKRDE